MGDECCAELHEAIADGQRIASYRVVFNEELVFAKGATVGHRRLQLFGLPTAVAVSSVRVVVESAYGTPRLVSAAIHAPGSWHWALRKTTSVEGTLHNNEQGAPDTGAQAARLLPLARSGSGGV